MPIFSVKFVRIYTGQKKFTRAPLVVLVTNIRYEFDQGYLSFFVTSLPNGSLWLPLWLPLALTCSLRLSLALSGSYWISPCLSLALYGSLWLPLWLSLALTATLWYTLALSGSLLLSNFAYTALDRLTGPLLGSHRRCHDDALYPALESTAVWNLFENSSDLVAKPVP